MKRISETAITRIAPRGRKDPLTSGWDSSVNCLGTLRRSFPRQLFKEHGSLRAEMSALRSDPSDRRPKIRLIRFPALSEY